MMKNVLFLILGLLYTACSISQKETAPKPVIYLDEKLDSLLRLDFQGHAQEFVLSIRTKKNTKVFAQAIRDYFGADRLFTVDGKLPIDSTSFHWFDIPTMGRKSMDVFITFSSMERYEEISFDFYGPDNLSLNHDQNIFRFIDSLARKILYNQPEGTVEPENKRYFHRLESSEPLIQPIQAQFEWFYNQDSLFRNYPLEVNLEIDHNGKAIIDDDITDYPTEKLKKVEDWVSRQQFPILISKNRNDTISYTVALIGYESDSSILNFHLSRLAQGILPDSTQIAEAIVLPPAAMGTRKPILLIQTERGWLYVFQVSSDNKAIPAGKFYNVSANDMIHLSLQDYDLDKKNELVLYSIPNMNGNREICILKWREDIQQMVVTGTFFGEIEGLSDGTLRLTHGGSWYMDVIDAYYGWSNNKLIPIKKSVIALRHQGNLREQCCLYFTYTNPYFKEGKDTLVIKSARFE